MKKLLVILLVLFAIEAKSQQKEYHLGHHAISLENDFAQLVGLQVNYHYILNPKDRVMWMPKVSIGYSPFEPSPYYDWGIDMAYGGKNRLVLGLGGTYNRYLRNSKTITGEIRYLNYGKKHLFYFFTYRTFYEYTCSSCDSFKESLGMAVLGAIGWKF